MTDKEELITMQVKINSLNFKIIEVDEIEKTNNDDGIIIGYTDYINQKILLLKIKLL